MGREHIAYRGASFVIEWYYTKNGQSPALEYYSSLNPDQRRKLLYLLKRMGDYGKISDKTKFNNEGNQIYAFKPQSERFLCFFMQESKIIKRTDFVKSNRNFLQRKRKEP